VSLLGRFLLLTAVWCAVSASEAAASCPPPTQPPAVKQVIRPRWVSNVLLTEYFPAPERWFTGRLVPVPGVTGRHRIDWLYSARGLAMQGEGIGSDGRFYHFAGPYSLTWRNRLGVQTYPCTRAPGHWTSGRPAWIGTTWLNRSGQVTYPLPGSRWSNGRPARAKRPPAAAQFAPGASLSLTYWQDVAVDPRLIQHGSSVFIRAYCGTPSKGWFTAADTGGAIIGRHIDVFRAPPQQPWRSRVLRRQKVFVVPPGFRRPGRVHC
jgi:3D (Asp-Asp-Asp) domain-containing protein